MASTDAKPMPQKNVAHRVTFPIFDATGSLVSGATSLDSEVSKDAGTFTDCTNEATEIATSSGMYYLDLTSTEMNADTVAIIVKSGNGKTTPITLYPEEAGDLRVNVTQISGDATAAAACSAPRATGRGARAVDGGRRVRGEGGTLSIAAPCPKNFTPFRLGPGAIPSGGVGPVMKRCQ